MTTMQKWAAIRALCGADVSLKQTAMDEPKWYVSTIGVNIGGDGFLKGFGGWASGPLEAIDEFWNIATQVKYPKYIQVERCGSVRRVRWNGFMWEDAA